MHPNQNLSQSPDALAQRRAELLALLRQAAPDVLSDNQIDLDKLKDLLGHERLADRQEHYELNWAGKTDALRDQLALFQRAEKTGQAQATDSQTAMLAELLLKHGLGALGVHAISVPKQVAGVTVHSVLLPDDQTMWLCFEPYTEALKDEIVKAQPARVVLLNSCFVGPQADELLANLQLELKALAIGLTVI